MSVEKEELEKDGEESGGAERPDEESVAVDPISFAPVGGYPTGKYAAYTVNLPTEQLAALQSIWLELKRMYGTHSPDKSGMIQQAITEWLKRWDGPDRAQLLRELLSIREQTRQRQYRK
jgi:hypothetical protein